MATTETWFKYPHCSILFILIALPVFIIPILKNIFGNVNNKHQKKGVNLQCRILLYAYFVMRTNDIFNGTYLEFGNCSKYSLVSWCFICVCTLVAPSSYIYTAQNWSIHHDTSGNGTFCVSDDKHLEYIQYLFGYGALNDFIYSITTILMMISRLFLLLTDNERKKSKTQKYEYGQENEPVAPSGPTSLAGSPQPSPRGGTAPQMFARQITAPPELMNNESAQLSLQQNASQEMPQIVHVSSMSMSQISDYGDHEQQQQKERRKKSMRRSTRVSKMDAIQFHDKTHDHNKLVLLMSKFFLILSTVVVSSQIMVFLFILFFREYVIILYSIDTIINIICLYLTFNFSDAYYNKYFCGRCCTKCCFPYIKAVALSCSEYSVTYQQTHDMDKTYKCCIYCQCCCFSSCRYFCCWSTDATPKEIYALAKFEIELMVATNEEKSITMQTVSRHSQKDAMVSHTNKSKENSEKEENSENSTNV